jgi:CBS domain containing-hemolysin-like protein
MDPWLVIIITLVCSAFFSGIEIAFLSSNKLQIELGKKKGMLSAQLVSEFIRNPRKFLITMLVGNNLALVIYSLAMAHVLGPLIESYIQTDGVVMIIQTIISTIIILITAEFLPKTLFNINPTQMILWFSIPAYIMYLPSQVIDFILTKIFGLKIHGGKLSFGKIDLDHFVQEATSKSREPEDLDHEIHIFQNALEFDEIKVKECMVPRTEIVALDIKDSLISLKAKFIETKFSKILIYDNNIDNIIGYVHSYELFKSPNSIKSILLPVTNIIPETMPANELMKSFIQQHKSIAVVVDEFGGTSGIVTMEDIIEEIFGEIEDEHDKESLVEIQQNEHQFLFSARLEIDYLNEKYNLEIPEHDDYETIGGFILFCHESIPKVNETIKIGRYTFKITAADINHIESVHLTIEG